jgi:hypothetical protein
MGRDPVVRVLSRSVGPRMQEPSDDGFEVSAAYFGDTLQQESPAVPRRMLQPAGNPLDRVAAP